MAADDMNHLPLLGPVALADVAVLNKKEQTYQGSWKKAGGRSAWFMFRRNMDRLLKMCEHVPFALAPDRIFRALEKGDAGLLLSHEEVQTLQKSLRSEDLFSLIRAAPGGADGTVLACLRDLRRYALLVEAEMVAEGVVQIEGSAPQSRVDVVDYAKLEAASFAGRGASGGEDRPFERRAIEQALRYLTDRVSEDTLVRKISPEEVLSCRPGGGVYGRIAEVIGTPKEEIQIKVSSGAFTPLVDGEWENPPTATYFSRVEDAIAHSLNYHGIDSALGCADHILASLLVPEVIRHLRGETGPQLIEAGWTIGPHGVPVPPHQEPTSSETPAEKLTQTYPDPESWSINFDWLIDELTSELQYSSDAVAVRRVQYVRTPHERAKLHAKRRPGTDQPVCWIQGSDNDTYGDLTSEHLSKIVLAWWVSEKSAHSVKARIQRREQGMQDQTGSYSTDIPALVKSIQSTRLRDGDVTTRQVRWGDLPLTPSTLVAARSEKGIQCWIEGFKMQTTGPLNPDSLSKIITGWKDDRGVASPEQDDPAEPGTPADGGHHSGEAERLVPRFSAAEGRPLTDPAVYEDLISLVREKCQTSDKLLTLSFADHGARRHPGPNLRLDFLRLMFEENTFAVHRHAINGENDSGGDWEVLSPSGLVQRASLWFPGYDVVNLPGMWFSREVTTYLQSKK